MTGKVLHWNPQRGFGFLVTKTETYYFHVSQFHGEPVVGDLVRFNLGPSKVPGKGPQAMNITVVGAADMYNAFKDGTK